MFSFIILIVIILVTLYHAFEYESTAIMLLVYIQAAFFLVSIFYLRYCKRNIKGKIQVPIGISETGKENLVKIIVKNGNFIPMMRMKACITVEDTIIKKSKKYWMKLSEAPQGEQTFIRSIVFPGTGNYEISLKKLRIYDVTGLMHVDISVESTERVQIMPSIYTVPVRLTSVTKNFYGESDKYDEHTPGHDRSELFQIREYQKGDRLHNIHWKLTAKQDEIMVKEHSLPMSCPVILFLNYNSSKLSKKNKKTTPYLDAAVSISFSIMDAGCAHYVVWYSSEEKDIMRIRVDDDESFYYYVTLLMKVKWEQPDEELEQRYREKYHSEPYIWSLSLDESLRFMKGNEMLVQLSKEELEDSLSKIEIQL